MNGQKNFPSQSRCLTVRGAVVEDSSECPQLSPGLHFWPDRCLIDTLCLARTEATPLQYRILRCVQDLADFAQDRIGCERLLKEGRTGVQYAVMDDGVICVTRHIKDLHVCAGESQMLSQLSATHPGHHHVGQHKVDCSLVLLTHADSFLGI